MILKVYLVALLWFSWQFLTLVSFSVVGLLGGGRPGSAVSWPVPADRGSDDPPIALMLSSPRYLGSGRETSALVSTMMSPGSTSASARTTRLTRPVMTLRLLLLGTPLIFGSAVQRALTPLVVSESFFSDGYVAA